ncbi:MAG TPA: hypothetical protein VFE05_11565 [Longimicrobiaceae bacterium]|jgi:hypothetical protein|nr:hypothetical protein [Longimicrobiaceae bacterium]
MCNPDWSRIFTPSELVVDVSADDGAEAVTTVIAVVNGNRTQQTVQGTAEFPLRFPIGPGDSYRVEVVVGSSGNPASAVVTSQVVGTDPRGPDVCVLRVDADNPSADNVIKAKGKAG